MKAFDILIVVDRATRPVLPEWVKSTSMFDRSGDGPSEYSLSDIELWLHDEQKKGGSILSQGHHIYRHLKTSGLINRALCLRDGEEIAKKGPDAFRSLQTSGRHYIVSLWKSVVRDQGNIYKVPYLYLDGTVVAIQWCALHLIQRDRHFSGLLSLPASQSH